MLNGAARAIPQDAVATRVWGGTLHSIANRLLQMYSQLAGLSPDFTIMDRADSEDFINVVRNGIGLARTDKRCPLKSTCLDIYSRRVNGDNDLETVQKNVVEYQVL